MLSHRDRNSDFISIVISDSTLIHTQLLAQVLDGDTSLKVVVAGPSAKNLLDVVERVPIDVAVVSYVLEDVPGRGPEILRDIRASRPGIKGVILMDSSRQQAVLDCFRAGASGIFSKHEKLENLRRCIHCVHEGQVWAASAELKYVFEALADSPLFCATNHRGIDLLSTRERQVVQFLAAGMSNREIAEALDLSPHTVKNYLFRIFDKLGVSNRMELLSMTLKSKGMPLFLPGAPGDPAEDYDEAMLASCKTAAEQGVVAAQLALARMLWKGRPSDRDVVEAYMWFCLASEEVNRAKDRLKETLSPEQQAMGERRVREQVDKSKSMRMQPRTTAETSRDPQRMMEKPSALAASKNA